MNTLKERIKAMFSAIIKQQDLNKAKEIANSRRARIELTRFSDRLGNALLLLESDSKIAIAEIKSQLCDDYLRSICP